MSCFPYVGAPTACPIKKSQKEKGFSIYVLSLNKSNNTGHASCAMLENESIVEGYLQEIINGEWVDRGENP